MNGNCDLPRHRVGMASCVVERERSICGKRVRAFHVELIVESRELPLLQSINNEIPSGQQRSIAQLILHGQATIGTGQAVVIQLLEISFYDTLSTPNPK